MVQPPPCCPMSRPSFREVPYLLPLSFVILFKGATWSNMVVIQGVQHVVIAKEFKLYNMIYVPVRQDTTVEGWTRRGWSKAYLSALMSKGAAGFPKRDGGIQWLRKYGGKGSQALLGEVRRGLGVRTNPLCLLVFEIINFFPLPLSLQWGRGEQKVAWAAAKGGNLLPLPHSPRHTALTKREINLY